MRSYLFAFLAAFCVLPAFAAEPTPAPAAAEPQSVVVAPAQDNCADGTCSTCRHSCRQGLFGRTVDRTVTVTRAIVAVPVRVATAPVRCFRARRGCCCR